MKKYSLEAYPPAIASRMLVLEALADILLHNTEMNAALDRHIEQSLLSPQDRAFTRRLVISTLRHYGLLQAVLAKVLKKPLAQKHRLTELLLVLGTAQAQWLDIPPYAAVHTTVELAKVYAPLHVALCNAILKKTTRPTALQGIDAARANTPTWLWQRWHAQYGEATTRAIALAHMDEPPLHLSFVSDEAKQGFFAQLREREGEPVFLPPATLSLAHGGTVTHLPDYDQGTWWVQDVAASLPVRLFGEGKGKTVIDLCAAPGGKTAQLLSAGAEVIAVDKSPRRLTRLTDNLARLRLHAEVVCADARVFTLRKKADAVLVDAPCSATGILRRHPDVAWQRTEADIARLTTVQQQLIHHAATLLKPGGVLVYAVCSLEKEEGEAQILDFLETHPDFQRTPVTPQELGGQGLYVSAAGDIRTLPCYMTELGGMDGFYAARLVKT
jgi:16S rRNA (cytosine967-C5)-methyltransferase